MAISAQRRVLGAPRLSRQRGVAQNSDTPFRCYDEKRESNGLALRLPTKTAKRITYVIGPDGKILKAYPKVSPPSIPEFCRRS
jgi:predicted amidohydrolase